MVLFIAPFVASRTLAAGAWTPLTHTAPGGVSLMQLLSDGTVMCQSGGSTTWYKLTPDANGHYLNGTWSTLASMHDTRTYWQSQVLPDGRLFASGGEYGTGGTNCETYDPLSNTWTQQAQPGKNFSDAEAVTLPNGNVMVATFTHGTPCLIYDIVANTWSSGPVVIDGQDETAWVKLPDSSILTIDNFKTNTERYIPALNQWVVDSPVPTTLFGYGGELGAGFLLPNGKIFYIGATNHTAIYTPSGTTSPGAWVAGADIPYNANAGTALGAVDSSAALMFNGKILCTLGTVTNFGSTSYFYEYDYTANSFAQVGSPTGGTSAAIIPYGTDLLDLPDGTVLFSYGNAQVYSYQPDGTPVTNGIPAIANVIVNYDNSYAVFGTLLNGISQGAAYGDDKQMDTGRPIAWVTNSSGNVQYCRTYNWSTCQVATGTNVVSTFMTLPSGLASGSYPLVVAANGISSAPYLLTVGGTITRPAAPTALSAAGGPNVVNLTWTQSTGSGVAFNRIYRSVNGSGGPFNVLATVPANTSYADTSAVGGNTYYYEVSAINGNSESAPTTAAGATALIPSGEDLADAYVRDGTYANNNFGSDTNLTVKLDGTSYQRESFLKFNVSGLTNVLSVKVQLVPDAINTGTRTLSFEWVTNDSWTESGITWNNKPAGTGVIFTNISQFTLGVPIVVDVTSQAQTQAAGDGVLSMRIYSNTSGGTTDLSFASKENPAITNRPQMIIVYAPVPAAPTALSAAGGSAVVNLSWTQSTGPGSITGNNVYRSTTGSGGPYNLLATLGATTSYPDTAVSGGSTYYYSVTAVGLGGESALSAYAGATTIPAAPTGLIATAGNNQVALSWTASTGASSYNVKRATVSGGSYTTIASGVSAASYTDTSAVNGTTYYYVVSAVNTTGQSANSSEASATPEPPAPTAPAAFTATAGNNQVSLSWTTSSGATSYYVKRSTTSGGPYTTIASGVTATGYTDTTTVNGTTYYYVVSAVNGGGESANSSEASATPEPPAPAAPTGLTATAGNNQAALSWTASSGATSYNVKRSTTSGGSYMTIASGVTATSYTDATAVNGTIYYYVVSAVNGGGESANSGEASAALTATLGTTADSYIRDGTYANSNFGTATTMAVKHDGTGYNRESFLTFDTTSATGVSNAIVKLYVASVNTSPSRTISVYAVPTTRWGETTITWSNAPATGALLGSFNVSNTTNVWYSFDVSSYIQSQRAGGTNEVSFALINNGAIDSKGDVSFATKEATTGQPQLVIIP